MKKETEEQREHRRQKFMEELGPYLARIPERQVCGLSEVEHDSMRNSWSRSVDMNRTSLNEFILKVLRNERILCAKLLRAIEQSWAPYDTISGLEQFIGYPDFGNLELKIRTAVRKLEQHGLVECQGERVRKVRRFDWNNEVLEEENEKS